MARKDRERRNLQRPGVYAGVSLNQAIGGLLATIAFVVLFLTFSSTTFAIATHWPGVLAGLAVLFLARYYLRADRPNP